MGFDGSGIANELSAPDAPEGSSRMPGTVETGARLGLGQRLAQIRESRLVRQNLTLFIGGLVAGIGGFGYHAIAGRVLGPAAYGPVAFLIAVFSVGTAAGPVLVVLVAR